MVSIAGFVALYQLFVKPHYWEKTEHGLHLQKRRSFISHVDGLYRGFREKNARVASATMAETMTGTGVSVTTSIKADELAGDDTRGEEAYAAQDEKFQSTQAKENEVLKKQDDNRESRSGESVLASKSFLKKWRGMIFSSEGMYLQILLFSNFLNFAFNAFLGRYLDFAEFALVSFVNTILYMTIIFFGAFSSAVNHETAYGLGEHTDRPRYLNWLTFSIQKSFVMMILFIPVWMVTAPWLALYFRVDLYVLYFFTPAFLFGIVAAASRGYIQGHSRFVLAGVLVAIETLSKFLLAVFFVFIGHTEMTYLSIPLSVIIAGCTAFFVVRKDFSMAIPLRTLKKTFVFPAKFYTATLMGSFGTLMFLNVDILLVKHYLDAKMAGEYALLALIGKMVFFFSTLPSALMITLVIRRGCFGIFIS
jgi:hypothetical protein